MGKSPEYMVLLTSKIYVANLRSDTVSVINAANYKERNDIPLGNQTQASYGPMHIAVDDNVSPPRIYVVNSINNTVSVIDGYKHKESNNIVVGDGPTDIVYDNFDNKIYVVNSRDNTVSVING